MSQLRHKNLINYECCVCMKKKDGILVYLVQDFVLGTSLYTISGNLGWCVEGAGMVAKGVLDAIVYLHNNSVFHNQLNDTAVFMDNTGTIRVSDFSLVPYLQELVGGPKGNRNDLPAMGALIESLLPTHPGDMRSYIDHCKSDRTLTAVELQSHPFLQPVLYPDKAVVVVESRMETLAVEAAKEAVVVAAATRNMVPVQSRLENEFEFIQFLGRGAYGDVLKVRNILDNRQYAIKRIPLTARSKQLYKKIRREVELLSRLNHENVVRYYNSWIELGLPNADFGQDEMETGDFSGSVEGSSSSDGDDDDEDGDESESSEDWNTVGFPAAHESSDDGIEFVTSDGECAIYVESSEEQQQHVPKSPKRRSGPEDKSLRRLRSPRMDNQFMYIQMEFCEKSTLRTAIDSGLFTDRERLWRLFREIAEGLAHIHQQGMIHRDLKPVNIFLDSRDQVKIGDFGLATTCFLALQSQEHNMSAQQSQTEMGTDTLTGLVGTALYVAPELTGNASKSNYNNKVDLYSLGIIFFEMCMPPFGTAMERVTTIHAVRTPEIEFPETVLRDSTLSQYVKVVRWLLNHDASKRPTSEELLSSDLIPPARLEATELQEMLRNVLANPQSKTYKHLVSRCLSQHNDEILELTYHMGMSVHSACLEYVKNKVVDLLRLHGAVEVTTPLLTPLESQHTHRNSVKLMTHSGCVVYLPYDFRMPLARQVALNGTTAMRRYSIGRVYREKKVFNFHPKQLYECAFDIINQGPGNLLADAEVLTIAYRITAEFPVLRNKSCVIRLNHTSLLMAILMHCNVANAKHSLLFQMLGEFMEARINKFQLTSAVNSLLSSSTNKSNTSTLIELLLTESPLGVKKSTVTGHSLRSLLKGRGEAAALANGAFREMEHVVNLAQQMGVACPIVLHTGISVLLDRTRSGVVWQFVADLKTSKSRGPDVMAVGGRYDDLLSGLQRTAANSGAISVPEKSICGVGFSFALDKLVLALGPNWCGSEYKAIDVLLCVTGSRPPTHIVTEIMRMLWSLKIRCGVLEATTLHEAEGAARDLGTRHLVILGEDGSLRVSSWENKIFNYHQMTRAELNEHFLRLKTNEGGDERGSQMTGSYGTYANSYSYASSAGTLQTYGGDSGSNSGSGKGGGGGPVQNVDVVFSVHEKLISHMRKRLHNQIVQQMQATLNLFNKAERVKVYALELTSQTLGAFVGVLDVREIIKGEGGEEGLNKIIERFPRQKKTLLATYEDIVDDIRASCWSVIGLYSISDNCYRILL